MEFSSVNLLFQTVKAVMSVVPKDRTVEDVVRDLRLLRFSDDGILSLMDAIINGTAKKGDTDELLKRLRNFNDKEWQIADAAARLIERCPKVSNLTHREIQLIGWRKPNIREELQDAINRYGQPRARIDKQELQSLRDRITELNNAIDEAEDKLLHGRRG